jgi:protein CpxP
MSRYTRRLTVTAGAALMAAGLATATFAQGGEERAPAREGRFLRGLDLTDAQRQQIREIRQSHRDEMQAAAERLRSAHRTQRESARATPVDEARIRATSQALADAMTEVAVLRARVHQQVLAVLTPEQQEKARALGSERGDGVRHRGRRGRMGFRGGPFRP